MRQYMPLKSTKRVFKVWVWADAVTGYFCDFDYVGKPSDGVSTDSSLEQRAMLQLYRPLQLSGVYDNFFPLLHFLKTS